MTMLDEAKTNGHAEPATRAWDIARLERRIAEIEEIGEQRVAILRDAIGDFCSTELAQRDGEIRTLKKHIADLEQKLRQKAAVDEQVHEIAMRLEEKAARRDEAKRGPQGLKGPKGEKGERGAPGKNGISIKQTVTIERWLVDTKTFTVAAQLSDGTPAPVLDLHPLFQRFLDEIWSWS
jgi:polyhydroxyalkanoate synthesis regulator phasin